MNTIDAAPGFPLRPEEQQIYAQIADVLIPSSQGMPSASEVDVPTRWINDALRLRPDLRPALIAALTAVRGYPDARSAIQAVAVQRPDLFAALGILTSGAYYMSPIVRDLIGYPGQEARALTDDTDMYLEMLERVLVRGAIYRPIPE